MDRRGVLKSQVMRSGLVSYHLAQVSEVFCHCGNGVCREHRLGPKSKSAFVNYRTGEALLDAMDRFHDSKFGRGGTVGISYSENW